MKQKITVEAMMEAGMHFGHQTFRRNPKMDPYIFDARDGIHIIDLTKTLPMLEKALEFAQSVVGEGKQIIFVGTKKQAGEIVKEYATACGMPYVNERWMGGLLTNFDTLKKRLKYMREIDERYAKNNFGDMTKKERSELDKAYKALQVSLGGLRDLHTLPAAIFVTSTLQDSIAVKEARKLKLPVIAMVDTNSDPSLVNYPIPSNDDARKAITFVVSLLAEACKTTVLAEPKTEPTEVKIAEETGVGSGLIDKVAEGTNGN